MAQHTVDAVLKVMQRRAGTARASRCSTKRLALFAATSRNREDHLVSRFGTESTAVRSLVEADASLGQPLVPGLPYLRAEAVYSARHELVVTLDDVLSRRTRGLIYDRRATATAARDVARLIAPELGWDDARIDGEVKRFLDVCAREDEAAVS
jgi:glycerol-3-phosphate dehydrogenase